MIRKVRVTIPQLGNIALAAYHPVMRRIKWLVLILIAAGIALVSFNLGSDRVVWSVDFMDQFGRQDKHLISARDQIGALTIEVEKLKRNAKVDAETTEHNQRILREKEIQIQRQEQELAFYRKLLAPESVNSGVKVKDFSVRASVQDSAYYYDFLLMQSGGGNKMAKGKVSISVDGSQGDVMRRIDIMPDDTDAMKYSFKYFQRLSGVFDLPANFKPQNVTLVISPSSKSIDKYKSSYLWQELMNRS